MRIARGLQRFLRSVDGAVAMEFIILLPVLLVLSLGGLEFSLILFEYHNATEATRRGARVAIIEAPMISVDNMTTAGITCTYRGASTPICTGVTTTTEATATFQKIADAIGTMVPHALTDANVVITVTYRDSELTDGAATNIYTPAVTVRMTGLTYDFLMGKLVGTSRIEFPGFDTTRVGPSELPS